MSKAIAQRLPDRPSRAAIVRTGLSVQGGIDALTAADQIAAVLDACPELLDREHWPELQHLILTAAATVQELQRSAIKKKTPPSRDRVCRDRMVAGTPLADLHASHKEALHTKEITDTTVVIDRVIAHDLAWVVSALLQLLELRLDAPADGRLATLPAMIKYGVDTPAACYASSIGTHDRAAAMALAAHCPHPEPTFGAFLDWLSPLDTEPPKPPSCAAAEPSPAP